VCTEVGAPLGSPCTRDEECTVDAFCLDPKLVNGDGEPFCSRSCCSSFDCGDPKRGLTCFPPLDGAGTLCFPFTAAGRAAPGFLAAGDPCRDPSECRSGRCDGECTDVCCSDATCPNPGHRCLVLPIAADNSDVWGCGKAPGRPATQCLEDDDCVTGRCLRLFPDLGICAEPCCSSNDCAPLVLGDHELPLACLATGTGSLRTCTLPPMGAARLPLGEACGSHAECESAYCHEDEAGAFCSDVCCDDTSCGDTIRFACRPVPADGNWILRCLRK
jgi:hypothetical protein